MTIYVNHYRHENWSGASATITITDVVDVTRAFVVGYGSTRQTGSPRSSHWLQLFRFSDTTHVVISREQVTSSTGGETNFIVVHCDEEEFLTEFLGPITIASSTTSVDHALARTFLPDRSLLVGTSNIDLAGTSGSDERYGFITPEFISSGASVRLKRGGSPAAGSDFAGWAVEFSRESGVRVETYEDSLSGDMATAAIEFSHTAQISIANTLGFVHFRHEASGLEQNSIEAWIDRTKRYYRRHTETTSYQSYARWYLVRFPSTRRLVVVRSNAEITTVSDLTINIDSPRNFSNPGTLIQHTNSCGGTGAGWARQRWVLDLIVDANTVTMERWRPDQNCRFRLTFADFEKFQIDHGAHLALGMCA